MRPTAPEPPAEAEPHARPATTGLPARRDVAGLPVREEVDTPPVDSELSRRTALKMISATALLAAGGAGFPRKPKRHIYSVPEGPEYQKPGQALHYASTWLEGAWPYGLKVKAVDGRPVKIEGLAEHPLDLGTSNAWMQASTLGLYDPQRLKTPRVEGNEATWEAADERVVAALREATSAVLITRSLLGPSERALVARFLAAVPGARHVVHETATDSARRAAWQEIYGDGVVMPDLSAAKIVLSVDADFLGTDGDTLSATRDFTARRKVDGDPTAARLSRVYVAESQMSLTGANADHRIPLRPALALPLVEALRAAVAGNALALDALANGHQLDGAVLRALASDLNEQRGECVVLAGGHLPRAVHAAVALLNAELGAPGKTLRWNAEPPTLPVTPAREIAAALEAGPDVVLCLGVNPVYDGPGGGFGDLFAKAAFSVGHALTRNETLEACTVALPSTHNLESWNDARPAPGFTSLCQPLIAPLFDGRQEADSLLAWLRGLAGDDESLPEDFHDFIRDRWQKEELVDVPAFGAAWVAALRRGWAGEAAPSPFPALREARANALVASAPRVGEGAFDLVILPHHAAYDGRFANNAWLLEYPEPMSKLVWDNAAAVGPATAERLGVGEGDWITVTAGAGTVDLPVLVQPGTAPGVVVTTLGLGRTSGAGVGDGVGFNTAPLLSDGEAPRLALGVKVARSPGGHAPHELVRTQRVFSQEGRPIVRHGTREEYLADPEFAKHRAHVPELRQLDPPWDYSKGRKWAMAIDLNACVGCGACSIACQAENNIPAVGKEECELGREMSWIRVDRYESGDHENPTIYQQPMLCQQCDNAPCEMVCPVNATVHSPEGLNEQVYNRCVGTRYCANNCPYKVRRFNFFAYTKNAVQSAEQELLHNPSVTVRMRGVMEKCTFCIQRINEEKFKAQNRGEEVEDGAVRPACQQACPAQAIVFGDENVEGSQIAAKRASPLAYHVLEELNVRPNVAYLARVTNPHPDVAPETPDEGGHR
ncbi:MAG: 4Fe-4S dicluster domain-containing protein [Planctomycetota bacterium]|jgi:molybdopterin-containing oxidoreductase family iron-sulfur binding subunit